jgi:excisionase family DNA binding protein
MCESAGGFVVSAELSFKSISVSEAANQLGVCPLTIRRLIKVGKLRATKIGRRVIIRTADLNAFLDSNEVTQ